MTENVIFYGLTFSFKTDVRWAGLDGQGREHQSEVQNMLMTEFNIDIAKEVWQEEAREEERQKGLKKVEDARKETQKKTLQKTVLNALKMNLLTDDIVKLTGMPREEIEALRRV